MFDILWMVLLCFVKLYRWAVSIAWYSGNADKQIGSHSGGYHLEAVLSRFSKEREEDKRGRKKRGYLGCKCY